MEKLLASGVIGKKYEAVARKLLAEKQKDYPTVNLAYLDVLMQFEWKKLLGDDYELGTSVMGSIPLDSVADADGIARVNDYILKLREAGVINEKEFKQAQQRIESRQSTHTLHVTYDLIQIAYFNWYWEPSRVMPFVTQLKSRSIVTTKYNELVNDITAQKLRDPIEFLTYCDRAVVINTEDYSEEPANYLEDIYRKTASILPGLALSDFTFEIVPNSNLQSDDLKVYDFLCSFKSNGKIYQSRSHYKAEGQKAEYFRLGKVDTQNYFKVFNDVLTDSKSPYKLCEMNGMGSDLFSPSSLVGIIALTKRQLSVFKKSGFISPH